MKITLEVSEVNINTKRILNKLDNDPVFWKYAASQWHRLYSPYVPFDQGELRSQVRIAPKEITHTVPYAHYQYEGQVYGPNYPISENGEIVGYYSQLGRPKRKMGRSLKYKHPKASRKWDKAAEPTQKPKLISTLQNYIDQGRLNLND